MPRRSSGAAAHSWLLAAAAQMATKITGGSYDKHYLAEYCGMLLLLLLLLCQVVDRICEA
jgi:hypothetical protein